MVVLGKKYICFAILHNIFLFKWGLFSNWSGFDSHLWRSSVAWPLGCPRPRGWAPPGRAAHQHLLRLGQRKYSASSRIRGHYCKIRSKTGNCLTVTWKTLGWSTAVWRSKSGSNLFLRSPDPNFVDGFTLKLKLAKPACSTISRHRQVSDPSFIKCFLPRTWH